MRCEEVVNFPCCMTLHGILVKTLTLCYELKRCPFIVFSFCFTNPIGHRCIAAILYLQSSFQNCMKLCVTEPMVKGFARIDCYPLVRVPDRSKSLILLFILLLIEGFPENKRCIKDYYFMEKQKKMNSGVGLSCFFYCFCCTFSFLSLHNLFVSFPRGQ